MAFSIVKRKPAFVPTGPAQIGSGLTAALHIPPSAGAAPAAVPTAAPPPPAPLPIDPSYEATLAALARQRDTTTGNLTADRQNAYSRYGYTQDAAGLHFDPSNPYSQAAMAKRHYDQQRAGNTTGLAARGQLYSGALQNAQNATNFADQQGQDSLQKQLLAFLANNTQAQAQAGVNYDIGAAGALSTRFQNVGY